MLFLSECIIANLFGPTTHPGPSVDC